MAKVKRYDGEDESFVEAGSGTNDTDGGAQPAKSQSFKEAFASARAGGDKTFTWNGKSYTTELASSKPSAPSKPAPKASSSSDSTPPSTPAKSTSGARVGRAGQATVEDRYPKVTEEGLARMRAKDESFRNAPSPLDNIRSVAKKLREKAGITSYAKGGSASSRGDGIAQRGKTRGTLVMCGGGRAKK